jgi:dTDP-glucose 4,6-dehydratase
MSRILITGALGAVGKPLWQVLEARGHEVWGLDLRHSERDRYVRCDVGDHRQLESAFKSHDFDYIYHAAAEFGRNNGEDYYEALWRTNAIGTKHIIRLQQERRFRMIFFSSSEVYGDWDDVMAEAVLDKHPLHQMNDYAISKWANELQILNSIARHSTETVRVRLFNTYGPGEYYSPYRSVICIFVYRALHNQPYTVYLNHRRTSTYIKECVESLANIVDNFKAGEVYNIAGDEYHDIKTLSDLVLGYLDKDDRLVTYADFESLNTRNKRTDNTKAQRDLGFVSTVRLEEGIPLTVEWQKQVYNVR